MYIFPAIDLYDGKAVRLFKGDYQQMTVYSENPIEIARDFEAAGAAFIHMVDLEGARDGSTPNLSIVADVAQNTSLFVEIGGGIRDMETVEKYLSAGVSRVILGTAAVNNEAFLREAVAKYGENAGQAVEEKPVGMVEGLKMSLGNNAFRAWLVIHGCFNLGLQMFLSGQNVLISGPMGLSGFQIAIINTTAFAPVPIMLIIYRKVMAAKGYRFAFQTALASFAVGMLFMCIAYVQWIPDTMVRLMLGATGGVISSYGVGAFFSAPTAMPTQIAAEEKKRTGRSHPSMYFAVQGIVNSLVAAIGPSLIWVNLRDVSVNGNDLFGAHAMTYLVIIFCVLAIFACKLLPKEYDELGRKQKAAK